MSVTITKGFGLKEAKDIVEAASDFCLEKYGCPLFRNGDGTSMQKIALIKLVRELSATIADENNAEIARAAEREAQRLAEQNISKYKVEAYDFCFGDRRSLETAYFTTYAAAIAYLVKIAYSRKYTTNQSVTVFGPHCHYETSQYLAWLNIHGDSWNIYDDLELGNYIAEGEYTF